MKAFRSEIVDEVIDLEQDLYVIILDSFFKTINVFMYSDSEILYIYKSTGLLIQ